MTAAPLSTGVEAARFVALLEDLGVPLLVSRPGRNGSEFVHPTGWQHLTADGNASRLAARGDGDAVLGVMGGQVAVVDIDPRNGGDVDAMLTVLDGLRVRIFAEVRTPGGGRHLYVDGHSDLASCHRLDGFPGVDIQSYGTLVYLPGTRRPRWGGRGYDVVTADLEALADGGDPDGAEALAGWVASHRPAGADAFTPCQQWPGGEPGGRAARYLDTMLAAITEDLAGAPDGQRGDLVFTKALRVGNYVAGSGLDRQRGVQALLDGARRNGHLADDGQRAIMASIGSGIRLGMNRPRATPDQQEAADQAALEAGFWASRPELAHVEAFARARIVSPWALLGACLLRIAHEVPPLLTLPPVIVAEASLNLFVALVARSGSGKSGALQAAQDCLLLPGGRTYTATPGSGEGIVAQYDTAARGGEVVHHRDAVLFVADEIDQLAAVGKGRSGSTLLTQLNSAFTGQRLGFAYAGADKRVTLADHSYRLGLLVGVQPLRAQWLLDEAHAGTPQRFLWLPATDATLTAEQVDEPAAYRVPLEFNGNMRLHVPDEVAQQVREAQAARQRGDGDALDGHAMLVRLKVAQLLTLLAGRLVMTPEDWRLAGIVLTRSETTRAGVVSALRADHEEAGRNRARLAGRLEAEQESSRYEATVQRVCRRILEHLADHQPAGWAAERRRLRSDERSAFEEALARLQESGQVVVSDTSRGREIRRRGRHE